MSFDSHTLLSLFVAGVGEVIKGWDVGVNGKPPSPWFVSRSMNAFVSFSCSLTFFLSVITRLARSPFLIIDVIDIRSSRCRDENRWQEKVGHPPSHGLWSEGRGRNHSRKRYSGVRRRISECKVEQALILSQISVSTWCRAFLPHSVGVFLLKICNL